MGTIHFFMGAHAFLGELAALAFLGASVEIYSRSEEGLARARLAASLGVILLFLSLFLAAYPYVLHYGPVVKSVIKAGPMPWGHDLVMESKEHIFMFVPVLALCAAISLFIAKKEGSSAPAYRYISGLCLLLVAMVFSMAGMGFIISTAVRLALGRGV